MLDPSNTDSIKLPAPFGLNILTARNAEIILVDSIWDALCVYQITGKVAIVLPNAKFSIRVRRNQFFKIINFKFKMNMAFEHLRKIHIWHSNDKALAFRLSNLFNPHRCFMIT
jgi:hypothetical protein